MGKENEFVNLNDVRFEASDLEKIEVDYSRFLETFEHVRENIETLLQEENRHLVEANEKLRAEIEERKRAELRLNDQLLFLEAFMDAIPNAISYYDKQGRLVGFNRAFTTFAALDEKELREKRRDEVLRIVERTVDVDRVLCHGRCLVEEVVVQTHAGEQREAVVYSAGYETSSNEPGGRVEVLADIKALRQVNLQQKTQEQMLIQQSKMAALGEMIGHIAEQWRRPLDVMQEVIDDIMKVYGEGKLDKRYIEDSILHGTELAERMADTIDDFSAFFKPSKYVTRFQLGRVVQHTLGLVEGTLKQAGISVEVTEREPVRIEGMENEYAQVLLNIVNNAKDALVERGVKKPRISVTLGREGAQSYVVVEDNAGGIAPRHLPRLFEPYFTTKGERMGTGIGLYMSRTIIEQNFGGSLTVENSDRGARFRIECPGV